MEINSIKTEHKDIFSRLLAGEPVRMNDPEYMQIHQAVIRTRKLVNLLNNSDDENEIRSYLSDITGNLVDETTTLFPPFHVNVGKFIKLGKNVFINHACSFLDLGGITIEDEVMIGPRVNLITENHPLDLADRKTLVTKPILIKRNAWVGAAATILPGVTIGENSVVAAGAIVSKDVPGNTVVAGIPAKVIKSIG